VAHGNVACTNCKNGISSYEIARDVKVTQKSAWFMLHRIRLAMQDESFGAKFGKDGGEVEVDESFVGGKMRNMHKDRKAAMFNSAAKPLTRRDSSISENRSAWNP